MSDIPRPFSSPMLDGPDRAPSRAMLYAVGFKKEDFAKPQIGIASTWSEVPPCNVHIDKLARESSSWVNAVGGKGITSTAASLVGPVALWGRRNLKFKDLPDFRPRQTLEMATTNIIPYPSRVGK